MRVPVFVVKRADTKMDYVIRGHFSHFIMNTNFLLKQSKTKVDINKMSRTLRLLLGQCEDKDIMPSVVQARYIHELASKSDPSYISCKW